MAAIAVGAPTATVTVRARRRLLRMRLRRRGAPPEVDKADHEWREQLSPEQYRVLRKKGTERAFTGKYVHTDDAGVYRCAAAARSCSSSDTKFDSGTGWPSFTEPAIAEAVEPARDLGLGHAPDRGHLPACGGHLGHVFNDGPGPTGQRYCINSCAARARRRSEAVALRSPAVEPTGRHRSPCHAHRNPALSARRTAAPPRPPVLRATRDAMRHPQHEDRNPTPAPRSPCHTHHPPAPTARRIGVTGIRVSSRPSHRATRLDHQPADLP